MICKNPKVFLIIFLIVLSLFLFYNNSYAVWEGDDDYTDPNNTIYLQYNSIVNDFIVRINRFKNDSNFPDLESYLKNSNYGYYIYYGNYDGSSVLNGMSYTQDELYIVFYDLASPNLSTSTYDNYCGIDTFIRYNNAIDSYFHISDRIYKSIGSTGGGVNMPSCLYNYRCDILTQYLYSNSNSLTAAIDNTTSSVDNLTNTITSRDDLAAQIETNTVIDNITVVSSSQDSNSSSLFNFISGFWTVINNNLGDDTVETLTISLPFVSGGITFCSDMLYNIIEGTLIYTLLQLAYYYFFGMYIVMGTWRILCWFQQGEFTKAKNIPIDNVMNHMLM